MKKQILFIMFILLFPVIVWAWGTVIISGNVSSGGSACDIIEDSETGADLSSKWIFAYTSQDWWSAKLIVDTSYTICAVDLYLVRSSTSPTYNITACIYTDDGSGQPGSQVGSCSTSIAASSIGTSLSWINFPNMSASVNSGTYHIVVKSDGVDSTNYVYWEYASVAGDNINYSGDGLTWTNTNNGNGFKFRTYK